MTKKIIAFVFIFSVFLTSSFSQAKNQTKIHSVDDENYMWYEFKAKQFGKVFKFYAFKTDTQRDNRTMQLFKRSGWGMAPNETITEFYNFEAAEKTVLWKEELMPIMKKGGYKYAFTTYRTTDNDKTTIYLYTFYYDQDHDDLYMLRSYK
jgi:hypothetical protein